MNNFPKICDGLAKISHCVNYMVPITTFYSWPLTEVKSNFVLLCVSSSNPTANLPLYWATMPQKDIPFFIENPDPLERTLLPSDYSLPVNFLYDVLDVCFSYV